MGGEEGGAYSRGGAYFKFWPIGGALIRRGRLFEGGGGGDNSKIYGIWCFLQVKLTRVSWWGEGLCSVTYPNVTQSCVTFCALHFVMKGFLSFQASSPPTTPITPSIASTLEKILSPTSPKSPLSPGSDEGKKTKA